MKHSRTFEVELIGASDTTQELSEWLTDIGRDIGAEIPHRVVSIESREFRHSQYGTVGHRYTAVVDVLR